jgi:tetratricopeptide (TPR) repeat protein
LIRNAKENNRFKQHHYICADMLESYFSEALTFYQERRAEHLFSAKAYESCIEPLLQAGIIRRQRNEYSVAHELFKKRDLCLDACCADENSPIRALGWIAEADTLLLESRLDEAEPIIERALELGLRTRSPVIQALAYKEKGLLLHYHNNITESIDALMASLSFFNQISERRRAAYLNDRAETLWLIGRICDMRHELDLARIYLQQAVEIQSQTKDQYGLARSYKSLGNTFQHGGLYEEARQNLEYALNIFQQMGYRIYIAHCMNDIGEIYRLGYHQPEQAEIYYRNAMDIYHGINPIDGSTTVINLVLLLLSKQRFTEAKSLIISQIEILEKAGQTFDLNWLYAELLPCCAATFDWPTFDQVVLQLGKLLEESMVVDADILYCTEMAADLATRYASQEQSRFCRNIAFQQAIKLNDQAAIQRLQN